MILEKQKNKYLPLAERMKPTKLSDFVGQDDILGEGSLLYRLIESDNLRSLIFYGQSGVGKTSIARIIARLTASQFLTLNAVMSGVKDIKAAVESAEQAMLNGTKTILFIDEIHRFNKSQQDALLPHVESGLIILIGATTENPYYEINKALISRTMVFELKPLNYSAVRTILERALSDERGLADLEINLTDEALDFIINYSNGDARKALNSLELAVLTMAKTDKLIDLAQVKRCFQRKDLQYDKLGDNHYDVISAFIKSIRGSDPDAALHYLARMLAAGEDVNFIARRIVISASEDVGNANPNALNVAVSAMQAVQFVGMPEARIALAQAVCYLASSPKSNRAYVAINEALADVEKGNIGDVPVYLRDSSYKSKQKNGNHVYLYPHDYHNAYVKQQYLPDALKDKKYYQPSDRGTERRLAEYLENIKK